MTERLAGRVSPPLPARDAGAALAILFFALPLAQTFPVPGVSVADAALSLLVLRVAYLLWRHRQLPRMPAWGWPALLLLAWTGVGALVLPAASPLPFSLLELAKSATKLGFYVLGGIAVSLGAALTDARRWRQALSWAAVAHCFVALYVYVAMQWQLPHRFLWTGSQGGESSALTLRFGEPFVRLRGVAAEPSYLGYFLVLSIATVLLHAPPPRRWGWRVALVVASIGLTLSLSAYALALVALVSLLWRWRHRLAHPGRNLAALVAAALLLLAIAPTLRTAFYTGVLERSAEILTSGPSSPELKRVVGSWWAASAMARRSPLLGSGLGNYDVALPAVQPEIDPRLQMGVRDQGWNVLAYGLGTLGWPGLTFLLGLLAVGFVRNPAGGLIMLVATFADGTLLAAPFWTFYVLLTLPPGAGGNGDQRTAATSPAKATAAAASPSQATAGLP